MFQMKSSAALLAGGVFALMMSGCGGSATQAAHVPFTATEAKGAVVGASCKVTGYGGSPVYATGLTTDSSGVLTGTLTFADGGAPEDAVILTICTGGSYFDEASGSFVPVPSGTTLTTASNSADIVAGKPVAVTPLTNLAYLDLVAATPSGTTPTGGGADSANDAIASVFGLPAGSLTTPPQVITSSTSSVTDPYSLILAGIAESASGGDPFAYVSSLAGASPSTLSTAQNSIASGIQNYASQSGVSVSPDLVSSTTTAVQNGNTSPQINPTTGGG